ncbi:MAG TPA: EVE domain-containing protein [Kofleriaceae bacterium]|nr:EVE domain-containing protein [Kofleriaceae bacterium]
MKTEPETFSFDDLERVRIEPWTGVRSMFARFHMRNMNIDDEVLFYHSSCEPPGVAGLARITRIRLVDETQFDPQSKYFDERATREKPIWDCAEVQFVRRLPRFVSLWEIRAEPSLADMPLLKKGMRLSVQPVTEAQYRRIVAMANEPAPPEPAPKPKAPAKKKPAKKKPVKKPAKKPAKQKKKR